jgi:methionyl-tRNA synthetase
MPHTLLTPYLPQAAQRVHATLGGSGQWSVRPEIREVDDLDGGPGYPVIMLDHDRGSARWHSTPVVPGTPIAEPTPIFTKLDPSVVEEELARLEQRRPPHLSHMIMSTLQPQTVAKST